MKKLLVLGVSGLTGSKIAGLAKDNYEVHGTYNSRKTDLAGCTALKLDVADLESASRAVSSLSPDTVINTTALHDVDFCEGHPDRADLVNHLAVANLKESCDRIGARFVHISTDYVFDGTGRTPYTESDTPAPVSRYGASKLAGERALAGSPHAVLRPSVVYGWTALELAGTPSSSGKPMNFAVWLLSKLHRNEPVSIVTDQFATATLADSLAASAIRTAETDASGVYHASGLDCESRYDFSVKLAEAFGYDPGVIQRTDSARFKQKARRPKYSCLDCGRAVSALGLDLLGTADALRIMRGQVLAEAPELVRG